MHNPVPAIPETFFHVECRACSRPLRVRKIWLGQEVMCTHCRFEFVAFDPSSTSGQIAGFDSFFGRIDELVNSLENCQSKSAITSSRSQCLSSASLTRCN
jgi:hypothetical protein